MFTGMAHLRINLFACETNKIMSETPNTPGLREQLTLRRPEASKEFAAERKRIEADWRARRQAAAKKYMQEVYKAVSGPEASSAFDAAIAMVELRTKTRTPDDKLSLMLIASNLVLAGEMRLKRWNRNWLDEDFYDHEG